MASNNNEATYVVLRDGRKLSYHLSSPPSSSAVTSDNRPIILLSNSLCAPYGTWDNYVSFLHGHDFRVLRYDQIGHGGSTVLPSKADGTTFETLADDVLQLLGSLQIEKLYGWVGISMGAATGIYFCTHNPGRVERLVVCDTISCSPIAAGIQDPFEARVVAARKAGRIDDTVEQTLARWFSAQWRQEHEAEVKRMRDVMLTTQVEGFAACCRALQDSKFDLRPLVGKLGGAVDKVMLVVGELDANLPETMSEMRRQIQSGFESERKNVTVEWAVIKNAGHVCVVDGFDQYSDVVTRFLEA